MDKLKSRDACNPRPWNGFDGGLEFISIACCSRAFLEWFKRILSLKHLIVKKMVGSLFGKKIINNVYHVMSPSLS